MMMNMKMRMKMRMKMKVKMNMNKKIMREFNNTFMMKIIEI